MVTITYKGKTVDSKFFDGKIEQDKVDFIKNNYFNENKEEALKQLKDVLLKGKTNINKIYSYYFERVASETVLFHSKYSIVEVLESPELTQLFINKTYLNDNVFKGDLLSNFKTAIRLGGKGITAKPTNFPLKSAISFLQKNILNNPNRTYIDTSCGWGVRMLASAILNINYIGFDVNKNLIVKLKELGEDIKKIRPFWKYEIIEEGSQIFKPELKGKADVMFTSPPYYNLEKYGDNSCDVEDTINQSYEDWKQLFLKPTLANSYEYIKDNGYVLWNIKSFNGLPLLEDSAKIGEEVGFEIERYETLTNVKRPKGYETTNNDNSEQVIVFKKSK